MERRASLKPVTHMSRPVSSRVGVVQPYAKSKNLSNWTRRSVGNLLAAEATPTEASSQRSFILKTHTPQSRFQQLKIRLPCAPRDLHQCRIRHETRPFYMTSDSKTLTFFACWNVSPLPPFSCPEIRHAFVHLRASLIYFLILPNPPNSNKGKRMYRNRNVNRHAGHGKAGRPNFLQTPPNLAG